MPVIPEPVANPELMPFLRWVRDNLERTIADLARKNELDGNVNSAQNGTMNMLAERLGQVQDSINGMIALATFSASQVTSGTFPDARIGTGINALKLTGNATLGRIDLSGNLYVPNSTIASFGSWTVAYIDGDGRLTRGASSARFKIDIVPEPMGADYFAAELSEFSMKDGNGWRILGYIAEDLVGTDMERFVVWERYLGEDEEYHILRDENGDPIPLSIDWIPLLLAQNTQLKREIEELRTDHNVRLENIEQRLEDLGGNN